MNEKEILILNGAMLENVRGIKEALEIISARLSNLEIKTSIIESRINSDLELGENIISEIREEINQVRKKILPIFPDADKLTIIEHRRIDRIVELLREHKALTSRQLGNLMGMSRTRANEYLKMIEGFRIAKGMDMGKERLYSLTVPE